MKIWRQAAARLRRPKDRKRQLTRFIDLERYMAGDRLSSADTYLLTYAPRVAARKCVLRLRQPASSRWMGRNRVGGYGFNRRRAACSLAAGNCGEGRDTAGSHMLENGNRFACRPAAPANVPHL